MLKVKRVTSPFGDDNQNVVDKLNSFFVQENLCKDDVVHISTEKSKIDDSFIAFYVFYDDGLPEVC